MTNRDLIFAWTQAVLAVIVVIGGGVLIAFAPQVEASAVVGVVGVVIGYFFGSAVAPAPFHATKTGGEGIGGKGK